MDATSQSPAVEPARPGASRRVRLAVAVGVGLGLALVLGTQVAAAFRTNVHWDEFGLLHQVDITRATGVFESGGRPGLSTVLLLPFVERCDDEVSVIRRARLLWVLFTGAFLAGLVVWVAALREDGGGWLDGALALALLALVPAFLESSVQVRTDQIALAGGAWGGALLLASRGRPAFAAVAGVAFGLGLLASQKLVYVAALAGLLALGQLWIAGEWRPRRDALRVVLLAAGAALVVVGFRLATEQSFEVPEQAAARAPITGAAVGESLSRFEFYRRTIGWSQYLGILPTLVPHLALLALLGCASFAGPGDGPSRRRLALAWAVLALGLAVALFHAAAFRYFWMTLGVFPAVALGLARREIGEVLPKPPQAPRTIAFAGLAAVLAVPAGLELTLRLRDTQEVQRASLGFIHRNFDRGAAGFHPERGLFCQDGSQPRFTWFSQHIHLRYGGDPAARDRNARRLIASFRDEPVLFILQSFRLNQFPAEVTGFWQEHYQPYRDSVFVAGRRLAGQRGERSRFELIVPGPYRWLPRGTPAALSIDGRVVEPGDVVSFEPGTHEATFLADLPDGMLVLALAEPPGEAPRRFYR
ncbi:MAG: hypothetical protein QNK04_10240 [Myxococcota bacterium]|nr:hypothetical protein [Myxococcota bacterium]